MEKALCNPEKCADAMRWWSYLVGFSRRRKETSLCKLWKLTQISTLYESMNEIEIGISLLKRSLSMLERIPQEQRMDGNVSARIGWLLLLTGKVEEVVAYLESAVERMKESFGPKNLGMGYIYKILGAAYMEMERAHTASPIVALAKDVMDVALGPHHADSIQSCQSLVNAYSAMGS